MKRSAIFCLLVAAFLCIACAAHAGVPALTPGEVADMEKLLGREDASGHYPAGSVYGTLESIRTFTDEAVSPLTMALEHHIILAEHAETADPSVSSVQSRLVAMDIDYDNDVVLPLEHLTYQLNDSAYRLSVLLDRYHDGTILDIETREARELAQNLRDIHTEVLSALPAFRGATAAASASFGSVDTDSLSSPALQKSVTALAAAIVLDESAKLGTDKNSGTFEVMDKHHFGIVCATDNQVMLDGVQVSVTANGKTSTATTDAKGCAKFDLGSFGLDGKEKVEIDAIATRSGYRQVEWQGLSVKGGGVVNAYMGVDDGSPYFSMMMIDGCDCLHERTLYYYWNTTESFKLNVRFVTKNQEPPASFQLYLPGNEKRYTHPLSQSSVDFDGVISATIPFNISDYPTRDSKEHPVIIEYYVTDKTTPVTQKESMLVVQASANEKVSTDIMPLGLFSPNDIGLELPWSLSKIFGGDDARPKFHLGIPNFNVSFYVGLDGTFILYLGPGLTPGEEPFATLAKDNSAAHRVREVAIEMQDRSAKNAQDAQEGVEPENGSAITKPFWLNKMSLSFSPFLTLMGKYTPDKNFILGGYFGLTVTGSLRFSHQVEMTADICYFAIDLKASLTVAFGGQIEFRSKDNLPQNIDVASYHLTGDIQIPLKITAGLSGGVGHPDLVALAVRGYGFLNPTIHLSTDGSTYLLKYGGGCELNLNVLGRPIANVPIFQASGSYQPDGQFHPFNESPNQVTVGNIHTVKAPVQTDYSLLRCPTGTLTGTPVVSAGGNLKPINPTLEVTFGTDLSLGNLKHCRGLDISTSQQHRMIFYLATTVENGKRKSDLCYGELSADIKSLTCNKLDGAWNSGGGYVYAYDFDVWYDTDVDVLYTLTAVSLSPDDPNYGDPDLGLLNSVAYINAYQFRGNILVPVGGTASAWKVYESTKPIYAPYVYGGGSTVADSNGFYLLGVRDVNAGNVTLYGGAVDLARGTVTQLDTRTFAAGDYGNVSRAGLVDMVFDASTYWKNAGDYAFNYYAVTAGETDVTAYDDNQKPYTYARASGHTLHVIRKNAAGNNQIYKDTSHTIIHLMDTPEENHCEMVEMATNAEGATTNRLSSLSVKSGSIEITQREIDTTVDAFGLCTINGNRCIYWVQNMKKSEGTDASYAIMAMMWDRTSNSYSAPFPLVAPTSEPLNALLFDWDEDASGDMTAYGIYATGSAKNPGPAMDLVTMTYQMQKALDVTGASAATTYMAAGEDGLFKIQVYNSGNTLISGFDVNATLVNGSKTVKYVYHVDTVTEDASYAQVMETNGNTDTLTARYNRHAIYRAPCVHDDPYEITTKTVDTIYPDPNARGAGGRAATTVSEKVAARGMMPATERIYHMKLRIPEDWQDDASVTLEISKIYTPKAGTMISVSEPFTSPADVFTWKEINDASTALMASNAPFLRIYQHAGKAIGGSRTRTLYMKKHDMSLKSTEISLAGTRYLKLEIRNDINTVGMAALPKDSRPVLTIKKDGAVVYSHTFARQIGDYGKNTNFTYHLLIPMDQLTQGLPFGELTSSVGMSYTSDPRGVDLNPYNNSDTVTRGTAVQPDPGPTPQPVPVTGDDTPVAAYAAGLILSLLVLTLSVCLPMLSGKRRD